MSRISCLLVVWLVCVSSLMAADVKIAEPNNDSISLNSSVTIRGAAVGDGAGPFVVKVRLGNGNVVNVPVANGIWQTNISLSQGTQTIQATIDGATDEIVITRSPSALAPRPQQKLFIRWNTGVDNELKAIAAGTLSPIPTAMEQTQFAADVKPRVAAILVERFQGVANIVLLNSTDPDAHVIDMLPASDNLFGQSPYDCGNLLAGQRSEVHVGTYRSAMVTDLLTEWKPMAKLDGLAMRVEDVAQALGRTAAHETTHSLGLVGDGFDCGWMSGCDGGHNCDAFQHSQISQRFDDGWFIMDPGGKTQNFARIAEPNPAQRSATRRAPVFNSFNRSYLKLVQP